MSSALCRGILAVFAAVLTQASTAASFDCTKASTSVEKAICSSPKLSLLDVNLDEKYREAMRASPSDLQNRIRDDQRRWLRTTRNTCTNNPCLARAYSLRLEELEDLLDRLARRATLADLREKANTPEYPRSAGAERQSPDEQVTQRSSANSSAPTQIAGESVESKRNRIAQAIYTEIRRWAKDSKWVFTRISDPDWGALYVSANVMPVVSESGQMLAGFLYKRERSNGVHIFHVSIVDAKLCDPRLGVGVAWMYEYQEHFPDRFVGAGQFQKQSYSDDFHKISNMSCTTLIGFLATDPKPR